MKNIFGISTWMLIVLMSLTFFTQCKDEDDNPQIEIVDMFVLDNVDGYSDINTAICQANLNNLPNSPLSQAEEDGILFMREEEKMARDFYIKMFEEWNAQIFDNIESSEETHFAAMLMLIEKYNLTDPAAGNAVGEFTNNDLQVLYDALIMQGNVSLIEALKAGAAIEEVDILDLENQLENIIDNEDLELVYLNLLAASRNHLRAAVKNLLNQGVTYMPVYLLQSDYDDITNSSWEQGYHGG